MRQFDHHQKSATRSRTLTANELTGITRNNELTVAGGLTNTPTSLSINGQGAGLYNDKTFAASGVGLNDGMNTFTAIMVTAGGSFTNSTTKTLPASVSLTSDLNGNLIYDGQKAYQNDCANELTSVTVSNSWRNEYVYDGFGRRRVAKNYVWYGGTWQEGAEKRYVYDGNNVIQERDGNNTVLVSYTRGTDLSGTMQDAGGIGGLLARTDVNGSAFYHADGNGNITMMIDASGNQLAKYLYDSFGNAIGIWGTLASVNTYRFSSKEIDTRSGLYYYGYRYYEPNYQRWIQRDPIAERAGINLYDYVGNNPINGVDPLGLWGIAFGNNSGSSYFNIGWGNPSLYFSPDVFNNPISGGVIASGSVEGGLGLGSGASLSGGGGLFYDPNGGVSVGGFQSAGAFAGSLSAVQSPSCNQNNPNFALGSSATIGSGLWLSNAGNPADLGGPFDQWNLNTTFLSISFAKSGNIWIWSLTSGGGSKASGGGYSISSYPTTTYSAGGFQLSNLQPIVYQP